LFEFFVFKTQTILLNTLRVLVWSSSFMGVFQHIVIFNNDPKNPIIFKLWKVFDRYSYDRRSPGLRLSASSF